MATLANFRVGEFVRSTPTPPGRHMRFSLPLLAATMFLAACEGSNRTSAASSGDAGGTIIIAPPADVETLFPPFVAHAADRWVQDQLFDRLAEIKPELNTLGDKGFEARLAQKWTWAPDSLSIAFSLDPRARWHDGQPLKANDVRYSFRAFTNPTVASPVAPLFSNIDSVSVRDSLTAVVWFKKHTPEQFYDVAYQLIIIPEHVYGSIPIEQLRTSELTQKPVGSGRFRFARWDRGTRLELVADTGNFRGRPKIDRLLFTPFDGATASTQVLAGQADVMEAFPIDRAPALDSSKVARAALLPSFGYGFMGMNAFAPKSITQPHPIFGDLRVRRALHTAVDRVSMVQNVFGKDGHLSYGPFPMTVRFADSTLRMYPFDTLAAKAMLDSSGWTPGPDGIRVKNGRPMRFNLAVPNTSLPRQRYAVLLQAQLKRVGIQADIDLVDNAAAMAKATSGDFDALVWAFGTDPGPSGVKQNWGTAGIGANGQNFLRYSNRIVDAQLDSAAAAFDEAKMKRHASAAFQAIIDDAPAIFLYDMSLIYGLHRRITLAPTRTDEWWANLADWHVPADKRIDRDRIGLASTQP